MIISVWVAGWTPYACICLLQVLHLLHGHHKQHHHQIIVVVNLDYWPGIGLFIIIIVVIIIIIIIMI